MSTLEEIWDDSALVDAFNDAVQQYKESHGEKKVNDNTKNASNENQGHPNGALSENNESNNKTNSHNKKRTIGEANETDQSQPDASLANDTQQNADYTNTSYNYDYSSYYPNTTYPQHAHQHQHTCTHHPYPPPFMPMMMPPFFPFMPFGMPPPNSAHLDDENLSQLLMSWYYAGYQTGYHQGKKQRAVQQPRDNVNTTSVNETKK